MLASVLIFRDTAALRESYSPMRTRLGPNLKCRGASVEHGRNKLLFPQLPIVSACIQQLPAKTRESGGMLRVGKCPLKQEARLVLSETHGCVIQNNSII